MSDPAPKSSGSFGARFLPGLIVGLVVGLLVGAFGLPLLDSNNTLKEAKKAAPPGAANAPRHTEELPPGAQPPTDPSKKPEATPPAAPAGSPGTPPPPAKP